MPKSYQEFDWSDVTPVDIAPKEIVLAAIAYSEEYKHVMGLLMAIYGEVSERALALTSACIDLNPAHYSVWDYRYDIIKSLKQPEDAQWLSDITLDNPKNYQVWNYRQHLKEPTPEFAKDEFAVATVVLGDDSKNFHAWSHLKWVAAQFSDTLTKEKLLQVSDGLLARDVYNNSAWSFRYYINYKLFPGQDDLEFVAAKIAEAPENEASWNYLLGTQPDSKIMEVALQYSNARALEAQASVSPTEHLFKQLNELEPYRSGLWNYKLKKHVK